MAPDGTKSPTNYCFAEHQGCYLVTIEGDGHSFIERVMNTGVLATYVGLTYEPECDILLGGFGVAQWMPLAALREASASFFRDWMEA